MTSSYVTPDAVAAIVGGYHRDPFAILGPHAHEGGVSVGAFLPHLGDVAVVPKGGEPVPMIRRHPEGFFEAWLPDAELPLDYQLQARLPGGEVATFEDPYRFAPLLTDFDAHLMSEGTHHRMFDKLGAHLVSHDGRAGTLFAVWAPNALRVSVVGDFNHWDGRRHPMRFHHDSGVWELFIPGLGQGTVYKYEVKSQFNNYLVLKSDPVGFYAEMRPDTASKVWDIDTYEWQDDAWLESGRAAANATDAPIAIYEVHLGSWRSKNNWEWLTYRELTEQLVPYVKELGYTHIELMPVAEHPFDGSWGYQVTGFFAPTSRFGTPDDFMAFVDACHQAGLGVILDWVPGHFPKDQHGLAFFDGTFLYEHADPRRGQHPEWGTLVFNYGRNEVRQFLIANALFWIEKYHIDGLRVDAVASILYLDFAREPGQWLPNRYGGRENLEAINFIKELNSLVHDQHPHAVTIAEESTSFPGVTHSLQDNGLGFDFKWNMGWMNDTLRYFGNDPIYRAFHHGSLTFSLMYAFSERFLLPFSHDEVVHLKKSMLDKMPGDHWQRFANLRLLYGFQYAHPGKKLQFMGGEFGQWREWSEARGLDWFSLDHDPRHRQMLAWMTELNGFYRHESTLYADDYSWNGFTWLDFRDAGRSILAFARHDNSRPEEPRLLLAICNFTPVVHNDYRVGVPAEGTYQEVLNSDETRFGGSGVLNPDPRASEAIPWHDQAQSISLRLPALATTFWRWSPVSNTDGAEKSQSDG